MISTKRAMPLGMLLSLHHVPFRSIHSPSLGRMHLKIQLPKSKTSAFFLGADFAVLLCVARAAACLLFHQRLSARSQEARQDTL